MRRTFNDYRDEDGMSFVKLKVGADHPFAGRSLADIGSATDMLVVLVLRDGTHPGAAQQRYRMKKATFW